MTNDRSTIPIDVAHLLPVLDNKLIAFLTNLQPRDWHRQTIAKQWKVKDVVAHLLDGNIRILSMLRDGYAGVQPAPNQPLTVFLNELNADWVKAMKRVSAEMLLYLHQATGKLYCDYYASLDPFAISPFAVDWAGEQESFNWMHIAREYTEKWIHQQQVRDTLGDTVLMSKELFYPFINILMMALPHTYRNVSADDGTTVKVNVISEIGGGWNLLRQHGNWLLKKEVAQHPSAEVSIEPSIAWKLFSKSIRPDNIISGVKIEGNLPLGEVALTMVSVMA
ncbi:MAG: maleylpyruvate isomerase N-terminal domain-containing protein [Ferruginibacter sp.]